MLGFPRKMEGNVMANLLAAGFRSFTNKLGITKPTGRERLKSRFAKLECHRSRFPHLDVAGFMSLAILKRLADTCEDHVADQLADFLVSARKRNQDYYREWTHVVASLPSMYWGFNVRGNVPAVSRANLLLCAYYDSKNDPEGTGLRTMTDAVGTLTAEQAASLENILLTARERGPLERTPGVALLAFVGECITRLGGNASGLPTVEEVLASAQQNLVHDMAHTIKVRETLKELRACGDGSKRPSFAENLSAPRW